MERTICIYHEIGVVMLLLRHNPSSYMNRGQLLVSVNLDLHYIYYIAFTIRQLLPFHTQGCISLFPGMNMSDFLLTPLYYAQSYSERVSSCCPGNTLCILDFLQALISPGCAIIDGYNDATTTLKGSFT